MSRLDLLIEKLADTMDRDNAVALVNDVLLDEISQPDVIEALLSIARSACCGRDWDDILIEAERYLNGQPLPGTTKPLYDALRKIVKYVRATEARSVEAKTDTDLLQLRGALLAADRDIREWISLAERMIQEIPETVPYRPTVDGVKASRKVLAEIGAALRAIRSPLDDCYCQGNP